REARMSHRDERWAADNFSERYRTPVGTSVLAEIEERVLGSAWGANGYTTRAQADELGVRLNLGPGARLCDVGAGRGRPGPYLAQRFHCDVVLTDLPLEGLAEASRTAADRGLEGRASMIVSSARALPLRAAAFDAVVHTDVL